MTEIDFYVLEGAAPGKREQFACKLVDKVHSLGHDIFIHTDNSAVANSINELLWTFRDDSFIPHGLAGEETDAKVIIGSGQAPASPPHLLINLSREVPEFFSQFERVAEVLDDSEEEREAGRERFRYYRDRGYDLKTHKLK
ncbi:MAG: DNA polymerase III subunit chi [Gammaproteobacteria bacterium]|nr:DNA polymerase III subunit chi [Gammaproteobacteria bacterium]